MEDVVRAKRFEVVDDDGRTRAALDTDPDDSVGLRLYDGTGQVRARLEVSAEEAPL